MTDEQIAEEQIALEEGAEMTEEEGETLKQALLGLARAIAFTPEPLTEQPTEECEDADCDR